MSKVIAGIFTIVGGLLTIYYIFVAITNSSYGLDYNDPKLHQSLFQTGHMVPLVVGILMTTVGLAFFFLAKESNPDIKG